MAINIRYQGNPGVKGDDGANATQVGTAGTTGLPAECKPIWAPRDDPPTRGGNGSRGSDGAPGEHGGAGGNASNYEIHVEVLYGGIEIDASGGQGGDGGKGGNGRAGGPGGQGGNGNGCEPSAFGGRGGNGGAGGRGGNAGNGGNGADVTIYYVSDQSGNDPPQITCSGGRPGALGSGGLGGAAGSPGAAGPDSDYAVSQYDPGQPPEPADPGPTGADGDQGVAGRDPATASWCRSRPSDGAAAPRRPRAPGSRYPVATRSSASRSRSSPPPRRRPSLVQRPLRLRAVPGQLEVVAVRVGDVDRLVRAVVGRLADRPVALVQAAVRVGQRRARRVAEARRGAGPSRRRAAAGRPSTSTC